MTDNNCCGGVDHDHGEEVEFSSEVQDAIAKYVVLMQEYDIPKELSAEELIQARMQTIYEGNGCEDEECVEEHDSPITIFMQNLLTEAGKAKELSEDDVTYIAGVVSTLDEAVYKDFIRITESLKLGVESDGCCVDDSCSESDDDICNGACADCTGVCHVGKPKYSHMHSADGIIKEESKEDDLDEDEENPHDKAIPSPFQ